MRRAGVVVGVAILVSVAGGCAGDAAPGDGWAGTIDTLPGGGVRVSSPGEGLWTDSSAWRLAEDLRIGSVDSEGPELFGDISDIAVDGEGRMYVLESQAQEVRVFGPDGTYLRTIGREGQGPGELNVPFGGQVFVGPGDRLWVNNSMNRRWELFTLEGEGLGSLPMGSNVFGVPAVLGRDGKTFYRQDMIRPTEAGDEPRQVVMRWRIEGDSLVPLDRLDAPEIPDGETIPVTLSSGGNSIHMEMPVPFVQQPSWSVGPSGHFWVEPGDGYRLVELGPELDTLRIVEREYAPVPVTPSELDEALARFSEGPLASAGVDVDRSRIPDSHPPFDAYRTDAVGNLWVRRTLGEDRWSWDVFDGEGRYLGAVRSDVDLGRLTVYEITDDAVYGVLLDDLDVPSVVRLSLVKGGR